MRPSPIESNSLFTALEAPVSGPERARDAVPPDAQTARFGQLFARVFGEQTRQAVAAASESAAGQQEQVYPEAADDVAAGLRAVHLGGGSQIITAGLPPADEDLLRYARDAAMDEDSVAALLRQSPLLGSADGAGIDAARTPPGAQEFSDASAEAAPDPTPSTTSFLTARARDIDAAVGARAANLLHSGQNQGVSRSTPASSGTSFSIALSQGSEPATQELGTRQWVQSRTGAVDAMAQTPRSGLTEELADGEPTAVEKSEAAVGDQKSEKRFSFEALRLRLGLHEVSSKDRLVKILGPEAVRAAQISQPEGARLEAIRLMDRMPEFVDLPKPTSGYSDSGVAQADALSALAAGGAGASAQGGGSEGSGARPDPGATQAGQQPRALPQQVLQRFGELLSQRILQQVSQGSWRVELDLEPGDLGSIRIELEFRKGEIEASIKASQATTRDLLQESLPRLREALERNGMDVASLSVGQQDRRQSGGQSSSGQPSSQQRPSSAQAQSSESSKGSGQTPGRDDGRLDVWV